MTRLNTKHACSSSYQPDPTVVNAALFKLEPLGAIPDSYIGRFRAMGSPCEIMMRHCTPLQSRQCIDLLTREVQRIETKFSRYRDNNVVAKINHSNGADVKVDAETARLLDSANALWEISEGLFDITSGSLRQAWVFDRSDRIPDPESVEALIEFVGWQHVKRGIDSICLPPGFEIDFGGIGKEYATDRCLQLAHSLGIQDVLVNLGGDIAASVASIDSEPWRIGIESIRHHTSSDTTIQFSRGGIATSGDTNKYLLKNGVRYSHVLDPRTGWPVKEAPQSITVAAANCTEAGMYSTLAMLQGRDAESFLTDNDIRYWIQRA